MHICHIRHSSFEQQLWPLHSKVSPFLQVQVFQSVLGYMGDAPMSYPLHLVVEPVQRGLAVLQVLPQRERRRVGVRPPTVCTEPARHVGRVDRAPRPGATSFLSTLLRCCSYRIWCCDRC